MIIEIRLKSGEVILVEGDEVKQELLPHPVLGGILPQALRVGEVRVQVYRQAKVVASYRAEEVIGWREQPAPGTPP